MKQLFILTLIFNCITLAKSQSPINPEDIIIKYGENGNIEVLNKQLISNNLDSFDLSFYDEIVPKLYTKKDSNYIRGNLLGKWKYNNSSRLNGTSVNVNNGFEIILKKDNSFVLKKGKEKIRGIWEFSKDNFAVITLIYSKPVLLIKDKKILKTMPPQIIERLTIEKESLTINDITSDRLTLINTIHLNGSEDNFVSIVLVNYKR